MAKRALDGVKVVEFAYLGITPMTGKILGTNGATVIRVESKVRLDPLRNSGPYIDGIASLEHSAEIAHVHSDKYGVTLNLKMPRGLAVARKLVAWADIVNDGFTTGALARAGLGYEDCRQINPDIIMLSSNTFGQTGPRASLPSTGIQLTGMMGFTALTGWPDREPVSLGYYSDFIVPHFSLLLLTAALDYRRRTGKGQHIDIAQSEASLYFNAAPLMDFQANHRLGKPHGNHSPSSSPHGVYRCQGDDRWCAIAVSSDAEWAGFCRALGNPSWTLESRFATFLGRKQNEDELDSLIESYTSQHPAPEVMRTLQAQGVAAGVVQTGEEVFNDPQLKHYGYFKSLFYPGIDKEVPTQLPFARLSRTPAEVRMPRPIMGEHNEYVCTQILGMPDAEFLELMAEGVFE